MRRVKLFTQTVLHSLTHTSKNNLNHLYNRRKPSNAKSEIINIIITKNKYLSSSSSPPPSLLRLSLGVSNQTYHPTNLIQEPANPMPMTISSKSPPPKLKTSGSVGGSEHENLIFNWPNHIPLERSHSPPIGVFRLSILSD